MTLPTFDQFKQDALARGFNEVLERRWAADTVLDTHTHPFSVEALVVEGEMWLIEGERQQHLVPGSTFQLAAHAPHGERYGSAGTVFWVARQH